MLGLRCSIHSLYNGAKAPAEPCDACTMIYAIHKSTQYVANLERVQPIKPQTKLGDYTTQSILDEIRRRVG